MVAELASALAAGDQGDRSDRGRVRRGRRDLVRLLTDLQATVRLALLESISAAAAPPGLEAP